MCLSKSSIEGNELVVRIVADNTALRGRLASAADHAGASHVVASLTTQHNNDDRPDRRPHTLVLSILEEKDWERARQVMRECPKAKALLVITNAELPRLPKPCVAVRPDKKLEDRIADALHKLAARYPAASAQSAEIDAMEQQRLASLTKREKEVLSLTAQGMTIKQIARRLHRAYGTVTRHRANIMQKLKLHDRVSLTRFAIRHGMTRL